jgi:hypothetical protein
MFAFLAETNGAVHTYLGCSSDLGMLRVKDQLCYPARAGTSHGKHFVWNWWVRETIFHIGQDTFLLPE